MSGTTLSGTQQKTHTVLALLALALGGFGIGVTEFSAMGLLSHLSSDLLPALYATDPEAANAQSGWLISAYAFGVVVGAPTIGILAAKYPRKGLLMILVAGFLAGTLLTILMPSFELVFVARVLSGLPHGAFFGVAALVAVELIGPERRARGVAIVLGGLTIANIVGVPLATWLGQNLHWRAAFVIVFIVFTLTMLSIALWVPRLPGDPSATALNELRAFRKPQVWFALAMGAIGFGGFFAVYSYVDPILTEVTGASGTLVPIALVLIGVGMTIGNFLGGRLADISVPGAVLFAFVAMTGSLLGVLTFVESLVGLLICLTLMGMSASTLSPSIQVRLMDVAEDSKTVAATANHASFNLANGLGAALGSVVIAQGFGYVAPIWVAIALTLGGFAIALVSFGLDRRQRTVLHMR